MPDGAHLLAAAAGLSAVLAASATAFTLVVSVALNTAADVVIAFAAGPLGRRLALSAKWWRRQRRATGGVLVGLGIYAAAADRR
jgi:threonine/homoserine/homoserine lactone efflux protein